MKIRMKHLRRKWKSNLIIITVHRHGNMFAQSEQNLHPQRFSEPDVKSEQPDSFLKSALQDSDQRPPEVQQKVWIPQWQNYRVRRRMGERTKITACINSDQWCLHNALTSSGCIRPQTPWSLKAFSQTICCLQGLDSYWLKKNWLLIWILLAIYM